MKSQTVLNKIKAYETNRNKKGYKKISVPIPFRKTLNMFKSKNLEMSATDFLGTSYRWYEITKTIKGSVVLNSFGYSSSTGKHVNKLRTIFSILGVKYIKIEAPKGLQDLSTSRDHHLTMLGSALVANKYARIKSTGLIKYHEKSLDHLAKFGYGHTKKQLNDAIKQAENNRLQKNKKLKEKSFAKKLTNYLENTCSFRDYRIVSKDLFGDQNAWVSRKMAVHQVVEKESLEADVSKALYNFNRDGFNKIIFYVGV